MLRVRSNGIDLAPFVLLTKAFCEENSAVLRKKIWEKSLNYVSTPFLCRGNRKRSNSLLLRKNFVTHHFWCRQESSYIIYLWILFAVCFLCQYWIIADQVGESKKLSRCEKANKFAITLSGPRYERLLWTTMYKFSKKQKS